MSDRVYGHRPSPEDKRDLVVSTPPAAVLPEVDLRKGPMPLVFDQGQLGSCTANAVAAALQFDASLDLVVKRARRRSRLDIYYGERELEGQLGQGDTGAYGRDGFKFAQQTGVLLEEMWKYNIDTYGGPPPVGKRHMLTKAYAVVPQDIEAIKSVLSNNQTIAFGFRVYQSFEDDPYLSNGIMPDPSGQFLGGHETLAVGYLAAYPDYVLVRNSWGTGWGIKGYFLMPWKYITDSYLASDLRTIVRV